MIKIAFFDIDGTSYLHTLKDSPNSTKVALQKLKENGIKIIFNTSRTYHELIELPNHFFTQSDALVCGGGSEIYIDQQCIVAHKLDKAEQDKILKILNEKNIPYRWTTALGDNHVSSNKEEIKQRFMDCYGMSPTYKQHTDEVLTHLLYFAQEQSIVDEIDKLCTKSEHLILGFSNEITAKGITKAHGIKECAEYFGIKLEETVAFGDGVNDIEMLKLAGIGIAMGNASHTLKTVANYVTEKIEEDGLYNACEHFNWFLERG